MSESYNNNVEEIDLNKEDLSQELKELRVWVEGWNKIRSILLSNWDRYLGEVNDKNMFDGIGTYTRKNGDSYHGPFQDGLPFWRWTYTREDGKTTYRWWFVNGFIGASAEGYKYNEEKCFGTYTRPDGTQYRWIFVDGKPGNGTWILIKNEKEEKLSWDNGRPWYKDSNGVFHLRAFWFKELNKLTIKPYHNLSLPTVIDSPTTTPHIPPAINPEDGDGEHSSQLGEQR